MDKIIEYFNKNFINWGIELPQNDIIERMNGFINKKGWLIQYCFGIEDGLEYLDYYSSHRMTSDEHIRIYENGKTKTLEYFWISYLTDCTDPEPIKSQKLKERGKEAFEKHNKEVAEILIKKGFNKFTINMTLNAGLVDE
jgi:hypothetical protein